MDIRLGYMEKAGYQLYTKFQIWTNQLSIFIMLQWVW